MWYYAIIHILNERGKVVNLLKINIENYKGIKKLDLNLLSNSNGIEKDIKLGIFKSTQDGKFGIPSFISVFGRNSIGKSSILTAVALVADLNNGLITQLVIQKMIEEEISADMSKNGKILPFYPGAKNPIDIGTKITKGIEQNDPEIHSKYLSILKKFLREQFNVCANDGRKKIKISLTLEINGDNVIYTFELDKEGNVINSVNTTTEKQNQEIIAYFKSVYIPASSYKMGDSFSQGLDIRTKIEDADWLSFIIIQLKNVLGEKKLISVLKLADTAIKRLEILGKGKSEIISAIVLENKKISLLSLSTGTRHFISMIFIVLFPVIKKSKNALILIDEIELGMHSELTDALKILMIDMFEKYNAQYIFTTHSPLAVYNFTSFKQVFSLSEGDGETIVTKLSSKYKTHQNIINAYTKGFISPYPDAEKLRNTVGTLFD